MAMPHSVSSDPSRQYVVRREHRPRGMSDSDKKKKTPVRCAHVGCSDACWYDRWGTALFGQPLHCLIDEAPQLRKISTTAPDYPISTVVPDYPISTNVLDCPISTIVPGYPMPIIVLLELHLRFLNSVRDMHTYQ